MREEIAAAVVFLKRLMLKCESIPSAKMEEFTKCLSGVLVDRFKDHWYKEKPDRGQGYRCLTFSPVEPVDPVLEKAASESGISLQEPLLPIEMTLWVDPNEVCCRIGDMRANYCMVASMKDGSLDNKAHTLDVTDFIQRARDLYNKQLNITTTRLNSNTNRSHARPSSWQSPIKSASPIDNHNYTNNHDNNSNSPITDRQFDNTINNNNRKFINQNNRRQQQFNNYNNYNNRQPFGQLDNGRPFIPPDFSVPPPPPPPMGFKPWQAPGAYSPPAKNKNLNSSFRNKSYNFKHGPPPPPPGPPPNGDRFHWQKDIH